jgi:hypothetical protein
VALEVRWALAAVAVEDHPVVRAGMPAMDVGAAVVHAVVDVTYSDLAVGRGQTWTRGTRR